MNKNFKKIFSMGPFYKSTGFIFHQKKYKLRNRGRLLLHEWESNGKEAEKDRKRERERKKK